MAKLLSPSSSFLKIINNDRIYKDKQIQLCW